MKSSRRLTTLARRATWRVRSLPDFIIIGAQKGGTTSLYDYLSASPDMNPARKKELHFFDVDAAYQRGERWYRSQFPIRSRRSTGESTPSLLFDERAPERVYRTVPDVRLIVMLREPSRRAVSHYWHNVRDGRETESLEAAFAAEDERLRSCAVGTRERKRWSYLTRGLYNEQLVRWFDLFEREQFLFLESEQFFADPASHTRRCLAWLGLAEAEGVSSYRPLNPGEYDDLQPALRRSLEQRFEAPNASLRVLLGADAPSWS